MSDLMFGVIVIEIGLFGTMLVIGLVDIIYRLEALLTEDHDDQT